MPVGFSRAAKTGQCGASLKSGTHNRKEREGGAEAGGGEGKKRAFQSRQPVGEELSSWKNQACLGLFILMTKIFAYDS